MCSLFIYIIVYSYTYFIFSHIYIYIYVYLSIEFACGKVPLRAHRDVGMRRSGFLVLSSDALLKVSLVDALPLVRKGTMGGGPSDQGANGSLRSNHGLGCRKSIFFQKCSHA